MLRRALLLVTALAVFVPMTAAAADAPPGTPTAQTSDGVPTVGPLFRDGLDQPHGCTASVLASPGGNLILTAAHCLTGSTVGYQFVPGYLNGTAPYGVWTVTAAYLPPQWLADQDPQHDYAILRVAGHGRTTLQDVTGGNALALAPEPGSVIIDVAYNEGIDDAPISCTVPTYRVEGYPAFNCHGYVGGSSGSPWLSTDPRSGRTVVRGVIGGLHQGGCYEYTSYTSAFRWDVYRLLFRAATRQRPDIAPTAGSDGC